MAKLTKIRTAQKPLAAEFVLSVGDTMRNTAGVDDHPINAVSGTSFDLFDLPPGSEVIGGELIVDEAFDSTGAATIAIGDSAVDDRYKAATTLKTAGRTALAPTGYVNMGGLPLRATLSLADDAATVGKVRVRVLYVVAGRANEVI